MPSKSKLSDKQIATIAQGKALGKPNAEIAVEAGCALTVVEHSKSDKRIGPLIQELRDKHRDELAELFAQSLRGMADDLKSEMPDIRVRTRSQVLKFVESADSSKTLDSLGKPSGDFTFEELLLVWKRTKANE